MFLRRSFGVSAAQNADGEYEFALSSDQPVERWFGIEVLDHTPEAVNLERLADGRHPLLLNHDTDSQVGVVRRAWLDLKERKVRVASKFSRAAKAQEIKQDVEDDIRTLVSVGYMIDEVKEEKRNDDGTIEMVRTLTGDAFEREMKQRHGETFDRILTSSTRETDKIPVFRVTRWTPFEASIVSVPADITVGKGRALELTTVVTQSTTKEVRFSPARIAITAEGAMENTVAGSASATAEPPKVVTSPEIEAQKAAHGLDIEKARKRAIENLCKANKLDDKYRDHWIGAGLSIEQVTDDLLNILEERGRTNPQPLSKLGLGSAEVKEFSVARAIKAISDNRWVGAEFELECSRAVAQKLGKAIEPTKFYVPFEVLQRAVDIKRSQRDLNVATAGAGGFLVETQNVGFIEMLRNRSVAFSMGARRLSGLVGSLTIPRQSAAATGVWLANEASTATESQQTFVQVAMSPKNVAAYTEISRQLLLQSNPSAEGIVTDDLAQVVAIAADLAVIAGSGAAGQPTGIINTAGIGGVTGTSIAYAGILEFQTDVASANVRPLAGGYITTPAVAALLMQRQRFTSTDTPLWAGNVWDGQVSGFKGMSSNQVPAANILFGDWNEVIVGEWGVLEVEVNPYANFQAGIIGVRAIYSMDVGVRRPFAFSLATSVT